jgi:hypothetical protein
VALVVTATAASTVVAKWGATSGGTWFDADCELLRRCRASDSELALDQLRSVVDFAAITSLIMSRGESEGSAGG